MPVITTGTSTATLMLAVKPPSWDVAVIHATREVVNCYLADSVDNSNPEVFAVVDFHAVVVEPIHSAQAYLFAVFDCCRCHIFGAAYPLPPVLIVYCLRCKDKHFI